MIAMTDQIVDQPVDVIARANTKNISRTGDNLTDGVLSGYGWAGGKLTYAFPDNKNDYGYKGERDKKFDNVSEKIEDAVQFALDKDFGGTANDGFSLEGFTNMKVSEGSDKSAMIRYAESSAPNPTAYAYYPSGQSIGGDVWFGTGNNGVANGYANAKMGNYQFATVLHETGHALGLKHGHLAQSFDKIKTVLSNNHDSLEYSVMTYHSYVGAKANGYTNETYGFPQTYMMADISALQHMYGANYSVNSGDTVYKWKPGSGDTLVNGEVGIDAIGNRIFATIWDGGGEHDKYDLSSYSSKLTIDLGPGEHSEFKKSQLADLNGFQSGKLADGNIYNALLYKNKDRSLIEDADGGSGNDKIAGNNGDNILTGNNGNDNLRGFKGNDTYAGGAGHDTFVFAKSYDKDVIGDFENGADRIDLKDFDIKNFTKLMNDVEQVGVDVVINLGKGDVLTLLVTTLDELDKTDFML